MGVLRTVGSGLLLAGLVTAAVATGGAAPASSPAQLDASDRTDPADQTGLSGPSGQPEPAGGHGDPTVLDTGPDLTFAALRDQALARIDYPWQQRLPGWDIEFVGPRQGFLGATFTHERRIEIYVDGDRGVEDLAFTVAHELGHAVDVTLLDGDERDRWLAARGATGKPWWAANAESDYAVGAGDWAEAFAVWQLGGSGYSTLAASPTGAQLALLASLAFDE